MYVDFWRGEGDTGGISEIWGWGDEVGMFMLGGVIKVHE
jgi:hypothetical protein